MGRLASHRDPDVNEAVRIIEGDPLVAGRVLAAARSHFYSPARKPRDLRQAIMRLGIRTLRDIAMEVSLQGAIFEQPVYAETLRALGRHSRATAHAVPSVCRAAGVRFEHAFLAGLFHDIGMAGALLCMGQKSSTRATPEPTAVMEAVDDIHGSLGMEMVTAWDLPAQLRTVVWRHQEVEFHGVSLVDAACVCIAEDIVLDLGWAPSSPGGDGPPVGRLDRATPRALELGMSALGLDSRKKEQLTEDIAEHLDEIESLDR